MRQDLKKLCLVVCLGLSVSLSLAPLAVDAQSEGDPRFDPTGLLNEGRRGHTATPLASGEILVVGGKRSGLTLSSAELFDPRTGTWTSAGELPTPSIYHTATRLPDGRVLIAGGETSVPNADPEGEAVSHALALDSAEIYDPATGTWSNTGKLHESRAEHAAVLLDSGMVLVVGGVAMDIGIDERSSAEIYDPVTGTWELSDSLAVARFDHTATLLPSGEVLVVGGFNITGTTVANAELFDPHTESWSQAGRLTVPRRDHTATFLPTTGQVLVTGGSSQVLVGNENVRTYPEEVELYDPMTNTWSITGSLHLARAKHSATLLPSGEVLVAGGQADERDPTDTAELYDPKIGQWTLLDAVIETGRRSHTATLLPSGQVLFAGGEAAIENGVASAEIFTPRILGWSEAKPLPEVRGGHTATLLPSGEVLVAGGGAVRTSVDLINEEFQALFGLVEPGDRTDLYEPETGTWSTSAPLGKARGTHTATLLPSGQVLVVGGIGIIGGQSAVLRSAELYAERAWSDAAAMRTPRLKHTATLLSSGRVLVAGGINEEAFTDPLAGGHGLAQASAELYDPVRDRWTGTGTMRFARMGHTATLLPDGRVLAAGGWSEDLFLRRNEIYDPATGSWSETGPLNSGRLLHTATLLPSGQVLIAGGLPASNAELFDPATGTWTDLGELNTESRLLHTATLLPDGRVLVAGGIDLQSDSQPIFFEAEIYDPALRAWLPVPRLLTPRILHSATLLPDGGVLVVGGGNRESGTLASVTLASVELYRPDLEPSRRRPEIREHSLHIRHGEVLTVTGTGLRGDAATSQGNTRDSATDLPLVQLRSLEEHQLFWLEPDSAPDFSGDEATLTMSEFPTALNPGWHLLTVFASGLPSEARFVEVGCDLVIAERPRNTTAPIGSTATFTVETQGGRSFQWQKDDVDIPGATGPSYTTPPIAAADSGTTYRVRVSNGCKTRRSRKARLVVEDNVEPMATVVSPNGGGFWLLSTPEKPNTEVVTWEMSDNIRICQVRVWLIYSNDGGQTYEPLDEMELDERGNVPNVTFGPGGACAHPGEGRTSVAYRLPETPPSGKVGSLYKVRLRVTDHAGNKTVVDSENPFFIVESNNESVKTLILTHRGRLEEKLNGDVDELWRKFGELADHPQVQGVVVDLALNTDTDELYELWDADSDAAEPDPILVNLVLFGCHEPLADGCSGERDGIHDVLRDRLDAFPEVENLILVGDDRIVPFARLKDRTVLFLESNYTSDDPSDVNASLTTRGTTVGQALTADQYLSDDPLAVFDAVRPDELQEDGNLFLPDLNVGRLVETPEEITNAIATFLSQDGVLDLTEPEDDHKVFVSGYDFLLDSGKRIRERWKDALDVPEPRDDSDLAPVDGELLSRSWGEDTVDARRDVFGFHLSGNGGDTYCIMNPSGHATHHELGVPGLDRLDIQGLAVDDFDAFEFPGSVVYAVGCHGGLPVPDDSGPAEHPTDLPQQMMASGVQAYIANTGYGWGLLNGVGLSERLVEIFTDELTSGGTVRVGPAMQRAKMLYFMESPRFDAYDAKTLMQWTLFGFPMYSIRTGIAADADDASRRPFTGLASKASALPSVERYGGVTVERRISGGESAMGVPDFTLPRFLTRVEQSFDFRGEDVYVKFDAEGDMIEDDVEGCPPAKSGEAEGCFYELNGLATGTSDLPIQPFFVFDSRLSGTSQHGVLWMGGTYTQEHGWVPLLGELASNGGDGSNHGSTPRKIFLHPRGPGRRRALGGEDAICRPSDLDINSVVYTAGEAVKENEDDEMYSIERLHRQVDLEVFYFNNTLTGEDNCDNSGPVFGDGPYHEVRGTLVEWSVPASGAASDAVWRVVVVYTDETLEDDLGRWTPVELTDDDDTGVWRGQVRVDGPARLTYFLQAVDQRGNVEWLEFVQDEEAASGVGLGIPRPIDVSVVPGTADLAVEVDDTPDPVAAGDPFVYTIAVSNQGPNPASSVVMTGTLPESATFVAADAGAEWTCGEPDGTMVCARDELAVGETSEITVVMMAPSRGRLRAEVEVRAVEDDPVAGNDSDSAETRVTP